MTPEEFKSITTQFEDGVRKLINRININTWIFSITLIIVSIILWRLILVSRAFTETAILTTQNAVNIAAVKTTQELNQQVILNYIKEQIEAMNKLQSDNSDPEIVKRRGLKVPKWPVPHASIPNGKITENDLQRIPQPGPSPSPIVKIKEKTVIKYRKPKPTPKPFPLNLFDKNNRDPHRMR